MIGNFSFTTLSISLQIPINRNDDYNKTQIKTKTIHSKSLSFHSKFYQHLKLYPYFVFEEELLPTQTHEEIQFVMFSTPQ